MTKATQIMDWAQIDSADGELHSAEIAVQMLAESAEFKFNDAAEGEEAQDRIFFLLRSLRRDIACARKILMQEVDKGRAAPV